MSPQWTRSLVLPLSALAFACSEGGATAQPGDAVGGDANLGDDVESPADAPDVDVQEPGDTSEPEDVDSDAEGPGDAVDITDDLGEDTGGDVLEPEIPSGTVVGTPLEGIAIEWSQAIDLCSAWTEGAPVVDEKARRIRVHLPPQTRLSLEPKDLAKATFEGLHLERGPFAADRVALPSTAPATFLSWTIQPSGVGGSYVVAELLTDLGDGNGTLLERWSVGRSPGDTRPIQVVSPELWTAEVVFAWDPPGDLQPALLVPCDPPPSLEPAVSVVVAEDAATKDAAVLLRYWYTGEVDAGSYPVWLAGHRLVTRDGAWWRTDDTTGPWSHTYSAKHHNFDDETEVDFARDLGRWHTHFKAPDPAISAVSKVTLDGVFGFGTASMTIERTEGENVTKMTLPVPKPNLGLRVDSLALARTLVSECEGGEALAVGGGELLVQLLFCSNDGEKLLVGVVPVVWSPAPSLAAVRYDTTTTVSGEHGRDYEVEIGAHRLKLIAQQGGAYAVEVVDSANQPVTSTWGIPEPLTVEAPRRELLAVSNGESGAAAVSFALDRVWAGFGVGKSQLWAPVSFSLTVGASTWTVTAWDALDYTNTHHNWDDSLVATAEDGTVLEWRVSFMGGVPNEVSATAKDGTVLLAPTVIKGGGP